MAARGQSPPVCFLPGRGEHVSWGAGRAAEVPSPCGSDLHFPGMMLSIFPGTCWPLVGLLWSNVYSSLLPNF